MARPEAGDARAGLIWLASYPKSGNTWLRVLLAHHLQDGEAGQGEEERIATIGVISGDRGSFDNITGLSSSDLTPDEIDLLRPAVYRRWATTASDRDRFVKVHDGWYRNRGGEAIFPADASRGAVLIVRHPMDVALSLSHHRGDADPEKAVALMCDPDQSIGGRNHRQFHQHTFGWSGHYRSWAQQDEIPVLTIRYEDMLADTGTVLARVLRFLALPGADDAARIARAVDLSRFDRLQGLEVAGGFRERPEKSRRFFRSGRAGEGIETLPPPLRDRLAEVHAETMAALGYWPGGTTAL